MVSEAVAPINAPVTSPTPDPGVKIMLSGTLLSMVLPWTMRLPSFMEMLGVTVILGDVSQ